MAAEARVTRISEFENAIEISGHRLVADEPVEVGGSGKGPDPYGFLLAALGSCISMTATLYAKRKGWPLEGVEVVLRHEKVYARDCEDCEEADDTLLDRIERKLRFDGPLDDAQRERLTEIAGRCPVHRTLTQNVRIVDVS